MQKIILFILAYSLFTSSALAGSFMVDPMRLQLKASDDIGNVTIFNADKEVKHIQVKAMLWHQDEETGADILEETKDLIFFPKIFSIPADGSQVVRVGFQHDVQDKEKSFRLFIRELPVDKPGVTGANFVVQISMPVFIAPVGTKPPTKPTLAGLEVHNGKLMLRANNPHPRYYSMNKVEMLGLTGKKEVYKDHVGGWYVLAGASRLFPLNISQKDCLKMDRLQVTGFVMDASSSVAEFEVNKKLCQTIQTSK